LFIVSSIALTRSFLTLSNFSFDLDRVLVAIGIVSVVAGFSILLSDGYFTYSSLHLLTTIDFILILVSATYCWHKNYRPARFFLLAWTALLLVGVLFSLRNLGIIQSNWFANNALYFGGIMQTLLISFALGDRINVLKKENERARQRELENEQKAKEKLEQEVSARTEEINQQKTQLEESNSVKDKLFSIISHDLKGPLNSLKGTLTIWQMGALNPEELKKMTHEIGHQLQQTSDLLDNLLQWSKSQLQGEVIRPERVSMRDLLASSTDLLAMEFKKKGILFSVSVEEPCEAFVVSI
jgi:signal transduction histidine kinase